jgi:hypothetical protein
MVNLSKDDFCDVCRLWRIITPADFVSVWDDGAPVNLCTIEAMGWNYPITRKAV